MCNCISEKRSLLGKTSHHLSPACTEISPDQGSLSKVDWVILMVHTQGHGCWDPATTGTCSLWTQEGGKNLPSLSFSQSMRQLCVYQKSLLPDSAVRGSGTTVSSIMVVEVLIALFWLLHCSVGWWPKLYICGRVLVWDWCTGEGPMLCPPAISSPAKSVWLGTQSVGCSWSFSLVGTFL